MFTVLFFFHFWVDWLTVHICSIWHTPNPNISHANLQTINKSRIENWKYISTRRQQYVVLSQTWVFRQTSGSKVKHRMVSPSVYRTLLILCAKPPDRSFNSQFHQSIKAKRKLSNIVDYPILLNQIRSMRCLQMWE